MIIFKTYITIIFLAFFMNHPTGDIEINITGLKNSKGHVLVGLYDNAANFPDKSKEAAAQGRAKINNGTAVVNFKNLPYGNYAAAILHDENNNNKMDFNIIGIPKEGYGFSNNAKGKFGPPSFEKAAIVLSGAKKAININTTYFLD